MMATSWSSSMGWLTSSPTMMPALLTSTSRAGMRRASPGQPPRCSRVRHVQVDDCMPGLAAATSSRAAARRPAMITRLPRRWNSSARPRPMPDPPPVIRIVWPVQSHRLPRLLEGGRSSRRTNCLEGGRRSAEQPGQHVRVADEVVAAVAGGDRAQHPDLVGDRRRVAVTDPRREVGVGVDLAHLDRAAEHPGDDLAQFVRGVATRARPARRWRRRARPPSASTRRATSATSLEVHHRLTALERPGQLEDAALEDRA